MSFSWTYLTRRFVLMNYRDYAAVGLISSYGLATVGTYVSQNEDNEWTMQCLYTDDETDIAYREATNKTDGAVKRERALAYRDKIRAMRAEKERELQLDAFNYLNGKALDL